MKDNSETLETETIYNPIQQIREPKSMTKTRKHGNRNNPNWLRTTVHKKKPRKAKGDNIII